MNPADLPPGTTQYVFVVNISPDVAVMLLAAFTLLLAASVLAHARLRSI